MSLATKVKFTLRPSITMLVAGIARIAAHDIRGRATPCFRLFSTWRTRSRVALAAIAVTLIAMIYLDPAVQIAQEAVTGTSEYIFERLTHLGKSGWVLWPAGLALLALLIVMPGRTAFPDRVVLAIALRVAFVFVAVGGSGLIVTIAKRIIGRARPGLFEVLGSTHFEFMAWQASYASFPSGHSQAAFAIATAFACLAPRWRWPLLALASLVAVSRIIVGAHYMTDIVWGAAWGAWFTIMTRDWFARRGLVFSPTASRAPFPVPRKRLIATVMRIFSLLRSGKPPVITRVNSPKANE